MFQGLFRGNLSKTRTGVQPAKLISKRTSLPLPAPTEQTQRAELSKRISNDIKNRTGIRRAEVTE
jgi:hypothetical protein